MNNRQQSFQGAKSRLGSHWGQESRAFLRLRTWSPSSPAGLTEACPEKSTLKTLFTKTNQGKCQLLGTQNAVLGREKALLFSGARDRNPNTKVPKKMAAVWGSWIP